MYITCNTPLPPYIPVPRFLMDLPLSNNARLLYGLLLSRTQLSQRNGWADEKGGAYAIYTISQLAADLHRSPRTAENALKELEEAGLLQRVRQGWNKPNKIFLMLPDSLPDAQKTAHPDAPEAAPCSVKKAAPCSVQNMQTIKKEMIHKEKRKQEIGSIAHYGHYQNVCLTAAQVEALRQEFPQQWRVYIEKLSRYMQRSGRRYADHEAVIRSWIVKDYPAQGDAAGRDIYQIAYEEGECL